MRIYKVTFEALIQGSDHCWESNWCSEKVAIEDGGAVAAIDKAQKRLVADDRHRARGLKVEYRATEVELLAEAD